MPSDPSGAARHDQPLLNAFLFVIGVAGCVAFADGNLLVLGFFLVLACAGLAGIVDALCELGGEEIEE